MSAASLCKQDVLYQLIAFSTWSVSFGSQIVASREQILVTFPSSVQFMPVITPTSAVVAITRPIWAKATRTEFSIPVLSASTPESDITTLESGVK